MWELAWFICFNLELPKFLKMFLSPKSVVPAALFLAAKVEEQPRKLEHVIKVANACLHHQETPLDTKSEVSVEEGEPGPAPRSGNGSRQPHLNRVAAAGQVQQDPGLGRGSFPNSSALTLPRAFWLLCGRRLFLSCSVATSALG